MGHDEHSDDVEERVRRLCLLLSGVEERASHGAPAFFANRQFVHVWAHGHHERSEPHLWCAAPPGAQEAAVAADPDRFFRPPYVGSRGWLGVVLDEATDWDELADMIEAAWRSVAPARVVRAADAARTSALPSPRRTPQ